MAKPARKLAKPPFEFVFGIGTLLIATPLFKRTL